MARLANVYAPGDDVDGALVSDLILKAALRPD